MEENSTVVLPEPQHNLKNIFIVSKKVLLEHIPYTEQHILRLEKQGQFPLRLQLGPNRVGWLLTELELWIEDLKQARDDPDAVPPRSDWSVAP